MRKKPERVGVMWVDHDFHRINHFVLLTADVMFVNGNKFLVTLSRRIRLFTAEFILTSTAAQLSSSIKKIVNLYARAGFVVNAILMDQEFDKIVDQVPLLEVNTTAAREHVGEIERGLRTIQERGRA